MWEGKETFALLTEQPRQTERHSHFHISFPENMSSYLWTPPWSSTLIYQ